MSEPHTSWYALFQVLKKQLSEVSAVSTLDWALSSYLLKTRGESIELPSIDVNGFLKKITYTATDTATLGFLIAMGLAEHSAPHFLEGLNRCVKQTAPTIGPSVHSDPKLLLGIVAAKHLLDIPQKKWLNEQLAVLVQDKELVTALSGAYAYSMIDVKAAAKAIESALRKSEPKSPDESVLTLLTLTTCSAEFSDSSRADLDRIRTKSMSSLYLLDGKTADSLILVAATIIMARLLRNALGSLENTAISRLVTILRRLPIAAKREPTPPADEYSVQRILWTMLAGDYVDLRDEQWLKEFGVYQPRADLAIESIKVVIEAKFIRKIADFRKVQNELIVDAKTYTQDLKRFDKVIAVVYDDSSSIHEHEKFCAALKSVEHMIDVVIFPRFNPKPSKRK